MDPQVLNICFDDEMMMMMIDDDKRGEGIFKEKKEEITVINP